MTDPFYVPPGSSSGPSFFGRLLSRLPYVGPAYNLAGTIDHLVHGTQGQYGPPTGLLGKISSAISGNSTNAPRAQPVYSNSGLQIDPFDPNNPLNDGTQPPVQAPNDPTDAPFYPGQTNTGPGNNNPVPVQTNNPTPGQHATNLENNFQTDFNNAQANAFQRFSRPDEIGLDGRLGFNASQGHPNNAANAAYAAAYPMGSTIPQYQAFSQGVLSGSIPSYQQFTGQPAYRPPVAAASPISTMLQSFIPPAGRI